MKTTARKLQPGCHLLWLGIFSSMPLSAFWAAPARAQVGLADEMANESIDKARTAQAQSSDYTFKSGDFRMLLSPAMSVQWNDNINLTESGKESDFILFPTLGVLMTYPLSDRNLLQLNVTGGYSDYVNHPHLSSWFLSTESGISLDFYIKDVSFNVHDQFSYVQNSSQNAQVAGTGTYGTFQNTAGLSGNWSLKYVDLTLGYDRGNTLATSAAFDQTDNANNTGYAKVGYKWNPKLTTGLEGTIADTTYKQNLLNDNTSYSAGVYGTWNPDSALQTSLRGGYTLLQFQQTSQQLQTSNLNSWYLDLNISHQITTAIKYTIDVGHNIGLGLQSDATEYSYANAGVTWNFIKNFSLQPTFGFQHGKQGIGSTPIGPLNPVLISQEEIYDWYSAGLAFNYELTKRFTVSCSYQFTSRTSSLPDRGYNQNIIGIQISYHPI
jgi:Putative beta-barrel porin 2